MKKRISFAILFISVLLTSSCSVFDQILEVSQLARCQFSIQNTKDLTIAGVNMQNKRSFSDFSFQDALALTNVLTSNEIPAQITIHVKAKNPNDKIAGMNRLR